MSIRNLPYIKSLPTFGVRLGETIDDIVKMVTNIAQQGNHNPTGQDQSPPPQVNKVTVAAGGGIAHVQVTDNNQVYRGIQYHVQYAKDSGFTNPITVHMGPSRDIRIPVGTSPLYYRAFSDYPTGSHSPPVYHGATPIAATGDAQPDIPQGQGSGTGFPSQISGFGPIPFRGATPPKRS